MAPLVSIIVPAYNVELYLSECLDSVIAQSYIYWELVLVNDGSMDATPVICDNYALKDKRIHVIHKENTGVSDSRNRALEEVIGEYVIFLDADDYWCDNTFLEKMIHIALKNNVDIVRGEYQAVNEKGSCLFCNPISAKRLEYSNKVITSYEFIRYVINGEFFLVLSLFKRSVLRNIKFERGRFFLEDMRFYSQILINDLRCFYISNVRFYSYRKNDNSISLKVNINKLRDSFDMCEFFHSIMSQTEQEKLSKYFLSYSIAMYYWTLDTLSSDLYYGKRNDYISILQLNAKRKKVYHWLVDNGLFFKSIIYYVSPRVGIFLFRVKHQFGKIKRILKY